MKRKIELLAPGGDIDSIKAAIAAGADAVYCGLNKFNARNRAANINFDDLDGIINLAHQNKCKVFLTLNIIIAGSEIPDLFRLLNKLVNTKIDGVIVQDFGLFYLLSTYFKGLEIHASTQLNTHNDGQIHFLSKLNASRVNLARELNLNEIKALTLTAQKRNVSTEVFVHGSYCISFSGICYMSSVHGGNSGNRGRCSQPCRDRYVTTPKGKNFPLNLKDNSAYSDLRKIADAGVASIKIEGRIKKFDYVYTVVNCWKKQINRFYHHNRVSSDNSELYRVFNRDFSNAYLTGDINKNMFIDNSRDHSVTYLSGKYLDGMNCHSANENRVKDEICLYEEKEDLSSDIKNKINQLSIAKIPLTISISGKTDTPLNVFVKTPDNSPVTSFTVLSKINLASKKKNSNAECLNFSILLERLKSINDTAYYIEHLELENLQNDLFISFNALTLIKKRILFILTGSNDRIEPVNVPFLKKQRPFKTKPVLCVFISSQKDLHLCKRTSADIFFQIPNGLQAEFLVLKDLFQKNKKIAPFFPSVLIGENYSAAVELLEQARPERIVTNNTGIAYEACKRKIPWIAGPCLNIINSFSLLCLKEKFNCSGAFISNEISRYQIKSIIRPADFKLYYSIYHPILLLTSRQCLFHQVTGCKKNTIDEKCIQTCNQSSTITNLKKVSLFIEKTKGNYHCMYNHKNLLNTDIVKDFPGFFSGFSIDLREIKTETNVATDKSGVITLFENFLNGNPDSEKELKRNIYPTMNNQYKKGI
ncbi:MAG: U32 family peptidase [Desulfobacteraceae bacterium]|jgi:putative protease|nr:U32 family peptidase [Desulfobacteraceae bacterium]